MKMKVMTINYSDDYDYDDYDYDDYYYYDDDSKYSNKTMIVNCKILAWYGDISNKMTENRKRKLNQYSLIKPSNP